MLKQTISSQNIFARLEEPKEDSLVVLSRQLEHFQQPPLVKHVALHAGPLKSLTQMKDDCQVQPLMFFSLLPVNHAHSLVFQTGAKRGNHCFHLNRASSAINLDLYLSLSIIPEVLRIFRRL